MIPPVGPPPLISKTHLWPALLASILFFRPVPAHAADTYQRLAASGMRERIVGNVVTDDSHWSDGFAPSGILNGIELGQLKPGTWKVQGNEMCVVRKARKPVEECFEIWMAKDQVEYRSNGVTLTTGILRRK